MHFTEDFAAFKKPAYLYAKGYVRERIFKLNFNRHFSDEEKQQNLDFAKTHSD